LIVIDRQQARALRADLEGKKESVDVGEWIERTS